MGCRSALHQEMTEARQPRLGEHIAWIWWATLAVMALLDGGVIWAAVTAPNPAAAWFFGGGAAVVSGLLILGAFVVVRHSTIFVEHGTLVARTPFSVRKLALAEVGRLEVRLQCTRSGIPYRELVVVDQGGAPRAIILADDFSDSSIALFAEAAGLRFKSDVN
jgi:hypothetical protein